MTPEVWLGIGSTVLSIVALLISLYTHRRDLVSQSQPVLVFSARAANRWCVENVGPGPAVYVLIGEGDSDGKWHAVVNCYPLAAGAQLELTWLRHAYELAAVYDDVHGRTYSTHCIHNRNRVFDENRYPDWRASFHEWSIRVEEATANLRTLSEADLEGLTAAQLDKKRNEPLARVGYIFTKPAIAALFVDEPWYRPAIADLNAARKLLSPEDRANMKFIAAYQERQGLRTG